MPRTIRSLAAPPCSGAPPSRIAADIVNPPRDASHFGERRLQALLALGPMATAPAEEAADPELLERMRREAADAQRAADERRAARVLEEQQRAQQEEKRREEQQRELAARAREEALRNAEAAQAAKAAAAAATATAAAVSYTHIRAHETQWSISGCGGGV